jgi:regulator of cell morphogenesis and NO signaling
METTTNEKLSVGEIVRDNFRSAAIFKSFGIDYCCGGKMSLEQACQKKNANIDEVRMALEKLEQPNSKDVPQFKNWDAGFLADYIVQEHHTYVKNAMPFIMELAAKVAKVHGHYYEELIQIEQLFLGVAQELKLHMLKEEQILFPFIKEIEKKLKDGKKPENALFGSVQNPIRMMEMEHESAGEAMRRINDLSNNYTLPEEACNSYRVLYASLQEFEENLHQHVHLENNILFPKAILLEQLLD